MLATVRRLTACLLFLVFLSGGPGDGFPGLMCAELKFAKAAFNTGGGLDSGGFRFVFNPLGPTRFMRAGFDTGLPTMQEAPKKPPKGARLGGATYKGLLQKSLSTALVIPKKAPKDKRITITGLKDGGFGFVQSPRPAKGIFDARVTVAVDKTKGLVSGQTLAGFELQRPAGAEPLQFTSLAAAYTEDEGGDFLGFVVQAFEDPGDAIDVAQLVEGSAEIDLRIQQTQTQLITMVRPTPPGGPDPTEVEGSGWIVVSTQDVPVPDDLFTLGFGASNLGKKGTVYFDFFSLEDTAPGPALEAGLFDELAGAVIHLGDARDALAADVPDLVLAEDELETARDTLTETQGALVAAMDLGTLHETTEAKTALKVLKRAIKGDDRLVTKLEAGKAKKPAKLEKPVQKVIDDTLVVMANLSGLKTSSPRQLTFVTPDLPVVVGGGPACSNPAPTGSEFATATHDGDAWQATTLLARELEDGRFDIQFEDCTGEGSYLLIAFTFPGDPSVGVFNVAPFGSVTGFAKNTKNPNAFGISFGGTLEITAFDPKTETLEGVFSADDLFGVGDALVGGSFRIEDFD
jgi:hypothetical protein